MKLDGFIALTAILIFGGGYVLSERPNARLVIDWEKLESMSETEISASELILNQSASTVCILPPYTHNIDALPPEIGRSLTEYMPVDEGDFILSVHENNGNLLGAERIRRMSGPRRAHAFYVGEDYKCLAIKDSKFLIEKGVDFNSISLTNSEKM